MPLLSYYLTFRELDHKARRQHLRVLFFRYRELLARGWTREKIQKFLEPIFGVKFG